MGLQLPMTKMVSMRKKKYQRPQRRRNQIEQDLVTNFFSEQYQGGGGVRSPPNKNRLRT
jgi:hypothetical protein